MWLLTCSFKSQNKTCSCRYCNRSFLRVISLFRIWWRAIFIILYVCCQMNACLFPNFVKFHIFRLSMIIQRLSFAQSSCLSWALLSHTAFLLSFINLLEWQNSSAKFSSLFRLFFFVLPNWNCSWPYFPSVVSRSSLLLPDILWVLANLHVLHELLVPLCGEVPSLLLLSFPEWADIFPSSSMFAWVTMHSGLACSGFSCNSTSILIYFNWIFLVIASATLALGIIQVSCANVCSTIFESCFVRFHLQNLQMEEQTHKPLFIHLIFSYSFFH